MDTQNDPYNLKAKHSAQEYKDALKACRGLLRGTKCLEMIRANYYAPDHQTTAADMAEAVGYKSYSSANLQYGKYASAIAKELGHTPGQLEGEEVPVTPDVAILVSFSGGTPKDKGVGWKLLPPVVQALEEMNWVRR